MWPERRKTNKMADAGTSTPVAASTPTIVETLMNYLGFVKVNFLTIPYAQTGTVIIGVDLDGKLKSKDELGNIREFLYV